MLPSYRVGASCGGNGTYNLVCRWSTDCFGIGWLLRVASDCFTWVEVFTTGSIALFLMVELPPAFARAEIIVSSLQLIEAYQALGRIQEMKKTTLLVRLLLPLLRFYSH